MIVITLEENAEIFCSPFLKIIIYEIWMRPWAISGVGGIPAHGKAVGTRFIFMSFQLQTFLWFYYLFLKKNGII